MLLGVLESLIVMDFLLVEAQEVDHHPLFYASISNIIHERRLDGRGVTFS